MPMPAMAIILTEDEQTLGDLIIWEPDHRRPDAELARQNGERACALAHSLLARYAIPEVRRRFFLDAEYNPGGRGSSRQQVFERNGTRGEDILSHPHFLKYLRYFIFGCALPKPVTEAFADAVEACGPITSGDVAPLAAQARALTRSRRLEPRFAAEEFFKLALDLGLSVDDAAAIRTSVL